MRWAGTTSLCLQTWRNDAVPEDCSNDAENSALHHWNQLHLNKYSNRRHLFWIITDLTVFFTLSDHTCVFSVLYQSSRTDQIRHEAEVRDQSMGPRPLFPMIDTQEARQSLLLSSFLCGPLSRRRAGVIGRAGRSPSAAGTLGGWGSGSGSGGWGWSGGRGWFGIRAGFGFGFGSRVGDGDGDGDGDGEAALFVPLHVTHTSDGLQLWFWGSPVVPVFVFAMFKHELTAAVARVHVAHPPEERDWSVRRQEVHFLWYLHS